MCLGLDRGMNIGFSTVTNVRFEFTCSWQLSFIFQRSNAIVGSQCPTAILKDSETRDIPFPEQLAMVGQSFKSGRGSSFGTTKSPIT